MKLSIRDIISAITVVGLIVALVLARFETQAARDETQAVQELLKRLTPEPHVQFPMSNPLRTRYSGRFTATTVGTFYPSNFEFRSTPQVCWKLINIANGKTVGQATEPMDPKTKIFSMNISPTEKLTGGYYLVDVEVLDGDKVIPGGEWSIIRVAN